jgi:CheY-like chemotaxis protein
MYHDLVHGVAAASGRVQAAPATLPFERRREPRRAAPGVEEAAGSGRLILVAEDNETNRDVVKEQLRLLGYAAELAADGVQALKMWRNGRYALLLTDCHMPQMDGFELTEAIRATEMAGQHLPIIAITANAMQGEAQRCRERGMDDYLSKPLRLSELGPMLTRWMPQSATPPEALDGPQAAAAPSAALSPPPDKADGLQLEDYPVWKSDTLTELVGDNPAMHKRLLDKFLLNAREQVAAMATACATGDTQTAAGVAHTLKSAARSVGALRLGELCQAMETTGHRGDVPACSALAGQLPALLEAAALAINNHA